jgi:predicted transcriptional regulator
MAFVQSLKNKGVKMDDNLREKLKAIAEKVLKQANVPNDEKFGSVIAILMMISIILTVIRVLQECNKNKTQDMTSENKQALYAENIRSYSKRRGWFTRLRIKRIIKRELTSEEYNKYGIKLTEALLDIGETLKDDEVSTLMEAANV